MSLYQCILIDPPWKYRNVKTGGSMKSGAAAHYPTMTFEQLAALKIPAEKDSVMFMWATVPMIQEALALMKHYRFVYKTMITWDKTNRNGMGYWYRGCTEHLLLGIKGHVKAFYMQERNILHLPAFRHSGKPDAFRQMINRACLKAKIDTKLEMFARGEAGAGWDVYGNEAINSITL